jgi:CheY-like chemotaxis protein
MKAIKILLVEDNPGDVELIREAFKEGRLVNEFDVVGDGQEAIDYLRKVGSYAKRSSPDMILLDLNLPKKDGRQVLMELKNDPILKRIPIVVLTTSASQEDISQAYENRANCYVRKPVDLNDFLDVMKQVENFWLSIVKLPSVS